MDTSRMFKNIACVLTGGPTHWINIGGQKLPVELHPYCGPTLMCKRDTSEPRKTYPTGFWKAIDRWVKGGQVIKDGILIVPDQCGQCGGLGLVDIATKLRPRRSCEVETCPNCDGKEVCHENDVTEGKES